MDSKLKEFTTGPPRDIIDRRFVVHKVYLVDDRLPSDPRQNPKCPTGRVTELRLPDLGPFYSRASRYRDYVAHCGVSDDAEKVYAVVAQVGVKKPPVRKELGRACGGDMPDSECDAPTWQLPPVRVTIAPRDGRRVTFAIRRQAESVSPEQEPDE